MKYILIPKKAPTLISKFATQLKELLSEKKHALTISSQSSLYKKKKTYVLTYKFHTNICIITLSIGVQKLKSWHIPIPAKTEHNTLLIDKMCNDVQKILDNKKYMRRSIYFSRRMSAMSFEISCELLAILEEKLPKEHEPRVYLDTGGLGIKHYGYYFRQRGRYYLEDLKVLLYFKKRIVYIWVIAEDELLFDFIGRVKTSLPDIVSRTLVN